MAKPNEIIEAMATRSMKKMRIAAVLPGGIHSYLTAKKRIVMEDGGPTITNPLLVGGNPNVGPATYYDHVPVARSSELDTVAYDLTRSVGTYVISEQEIDENQGDAKIVDIAAAKLKSLEIAIKKYQRKNMANTNAGKYPQGLGNLLPLVNTAGTIGSINLAVEPMFRHNVYQFAGTVTSANIEDTFDDILLDLNTDDGKVTVIFAGRRIFSMHRAAARAKDTQRELGPDGWGQGLANLGLTGSKHQQIPIIYDEELDTDTAYFINEDELMVHILKSANMKLKNLEAPYDQDVIGKRYIIEHQLCSWKQYRTHGFFINR
jgi:hypothetical protein